MTLYVKLLIAVAVFGLIGFFVYDYNNTKKEAAKLSVAVESQQRMIENQFDTILAIEDALDEITKSKETIREKQQVRQASTKEKVTKLTESTPDMFEKNLNESFQEILK